MPEPTSAQYPLGLQLEQKQLKGALLSKKGEALQVLRLFSLEVGKEETGPRHISVLNTLRPALPRDKLRRALFATGIDTRHTLIRPLDIKLTKNKDIDAVLAYQAEPLLPFPIDEAVVDRMTLSKDEEGSQLAVFAARKSDLGSHLESFQSLNIEPEAVSCYPAALAAFSAAYCPQDEPIFVVDLGLDAITTLLIDDGKVLAAHSSSSNITIFKKALNKAEQGGEATDFHKLVQENDTELHASLQSLQQELARALFALGKQTHGQPIQTVLFVGEGACFNNLPDYLAQATQKSVALPQSPQQEQVSADDLKRYAIPIGLALQYLPGAQHQLNFRQQELAYPYPWKRLKQPLTLYLVACAFICLFFLLISQKRSLSHENYIRQQYSNLLQVLQVEQTEFEQTAMGAVPGDEKNISQLSMGEINARLKWIEDDIAKTPQVFPLKPNVPRVSDLLAWITSHPKVVRTDPVTGKKQALLQIESFNYTMIKRPDKSKQRERYQVKVEIDFSSMEPKWAREFYDALIAPNDFVDTRGEVKWSAAKGSYTTSFFLKDRTYYP